MTLKAFIDHADSQPLKGGKANTAVRLVALLAEKFPAAFVPYEQHRRPLKVAIHEDIMRVLGNEVARWKVRKALAFYTNASGYLRASVEGAPRIDLNGEAVGVVTAGEEAHARERLAKNRAARSPKAASCPSPASPAPTPAPAPRRDGLAALREAARARKAAASSTAPTSQRSVQAKTRVVPDYTPINGLRLQIQHHSHRARGCHANVVRIWPGPEGRMVLRCLACDRTVTWLRDETADTLLKLVRYFPDVAKQTLILRDFHSRYVVVPPTLDIPYDQEEERALELEQDRIREEREHEN